MNTQIPFVKQRLAANQLWGAGHFVLDQRTGECTPTSRLGLLSEHKNNMTPAAPASPAPSSLTPDI